MTSRKRIENILIGIGMIAAGIGMIFNPDEGYLFVGVILAIMMIAGGIRYLIYYAAMARYMVGGKRILYMGIILFDMGVVVGGLATFPRIYILLYLLGGYAFTGLVCVLRAREAKRLGAKTWRTTMLHGAVDIVIAVSCLFFYGQAKIVVYIYCAGLLHSALIRIAGAFRKTAIAYIP